MIKNFEKYINEDYFSKLASRKDNGEVRKENSNELVNNFLQGIKKGEYNFVSLDGVIDNAEILAEDFIIKFNEIEDFDAALPEEYHVMTAKEYDVLFGGSFNKLHKVPSDFGGNTYGLNINNGIIRWNNTYSHIFAANVHEILQDFSGSLHCYFSWGVSERSYELMPVTCCETSRYDENHHYVKIIRNVLKINEDYFSRLASRKDNGIVRKENMAKYYFVADTDESDTFKDDVLGNMNYGTIVESKDNWFYIVETTSANFEDKLYKDTIHAFSHFIMQTGCKTSDIIHTKKWPDLEGDEKWMENWFEDDVEYQKILLEYEIEKCIIIDTDEII